MGVIVAPPAVVIAEESAMLGPVTPLAYERYAVLVSPLLIPGAAPPGAPTEGKGPKPVTRTAATTNNRQEGRQMLTSLPGHRGPKHASAVVDSSASMPAKASMPAVHPAPETGRGQLLDVFA